MARENKISKLSNKVHKVIELHAKLPDWLTKRDGRVGGFITVVDSKTEHIYAKFKVAHVDKSISKKCFDLSQEKAERLFGRMNTLGDKTSAESMDVASEEYPGAIFCPYLNKIFSFSGIPMWSDEACMFATSVLMIDDSEKRSEWIAEIYHIYASRGSGVHRRGLFVFTYLLMSLQKEYKDEFIVDPALVA